MGGEGVLRALNGRVQGLVFKCGPVSRPCGESFPIGILKEHFAPPPAFEDSGVFSVQAPCPHFLLLIESALQNLLELPRLLISPHPSPAGTASAGEGGGGKGAEG